MRWQALIVLLAILGCTIAPHPLPPIFAKEGKPLIGILNVCHSATSALESDGDVQFTSGGQGIQAPISLVTSSERPKAFFTQTLLPKANEHPPKA